MARRKTRQTRISFQPVPSSSPLRGKRTEDHQTLPTPSASLRQSSPARPSSDLLQSSGDDDDDVPLQKTRRAGPPEGTRKKQALTGNQISTPTKIFTPGSRASGQPAESRILRSGRSPKLPSTSSSSSSAVAVPSNSSKRKGKLRSTRQQAGSSPSKAPAVNRESRRVTRSLGKPVDHEVVTLSDDEESAKPRRVTRSATKITSSAMVVLSDDEDPPGETLLPDLGEAETSGDEVIVSPQARRRRAATTQAELNGSNAQVSDDTDVDSLIGSAKRPQQRHTVPSDEEDIVSPSTRRGKRLPSSRTAVAETQSQPAPLNQSDESGSEVASPRKRRRLISLRTPPKPMAQQDIDDLDEDLEFLRSSPPRNVSSSAIAKTAKQKALEHLKKRRAGAASSQSVGPEQVSDESEDQSEVSSRGDNDATILEMFQEDEGDEGFVVDEEDDTLGAPDAEMPIEFSALGRAKAKDLFKHAIEWMVQKKINPAFSIDDPIYNLAFQKLDDEVKGLASSKFTSSAWNEQFTRALLSRPNISELDVRGGAGIYYHCVACNRTNHPATFEVQFSGKPYHPETLEEISDDEDSDDDEEEEEPTKATHDSKGRLVPPENRMYHLGQFCMANTRTAHALAHWRFHLNEWVVDYLKQEGYTSPEKVVERDSWNTKKRQKYANAVVDEMHEQGEIKRLYKDYRANIDNARLAKQTRWR